MNISLIGLDIAKSVFHLVLFNRAGKELKRKMLKRNQVAQFFIQTEPCLVVMEACGSASYWATKIISLGHQVKLIAPQYVKPYVRGNKNDYNDAKAIAEASRVADMNFVPIKTSAQQDIQMLHRIRSRLVKNRTSLSNQVRGLLAEYGIIIQKGLGNVRKKLPSIVEDAENGLSVSAREDFQILYDEFVSQDGKVVRYDKKIKQVNKANPSCQRLNKVRGVGPITATALHAMVGQAKEFKNGRHMAAWIGLVPGQHSTGGKNNLLGISKRGNNYLRGLLIHGARSVLKYSAGKDDKLSLWAESLKERRGYNKACVAMANKMARICWVILNREEEFHQA